jgi:hypothetical protein
VLDAGRLPASRVVVAIAASIDGLTEVVPTAVRVLDVAEGTDGDLVVTLAVPSAQAIAIAQLAATDQLLLVGRSTAGAP